MGSVLCFFVTCFRILSEDDNKNSWYQSWELTGYAELETRGFFRDAAYRGQDENAGVSVALEPEFFRAAQSNGMDFLFQPFLRLDSMDSERTHWDIRELWWRKSWGNLDLTAGVGKVFWGVAESQHLVDTINQTDWIENIDGEEKLGSPCCMQVGLRQK